MKHLKLFENFENWGFMEYLLDSLTYIFDEYKHEVKGDVVCIECDHQSNAESILAEVEKEVEALRKKFNFIISIYTTNGQFRKTEIRIMEVKEEWVDWINAKLDACKDITDELTQLRSEGQSKEYGIYNKRMYRVLFLWREIDVDYDNFVNKFIKHYGLSRDRSATYYTLFHYVISKKLNLERYCIRIA